MTTKAELRKMTVNDLRALSKKYRIGLGGARTKEEIVNTVAKAMSKSINKYRGGGTGCSKQTSEWGLYNQISDYTKSIRDLLHTKNINTSGETLDAAHQLCKCAWKHDNNIHGVTEDIFVASFKAYHACVISDMKEYNKDCEIQDAVLDALIKRFQELKVERIDSVHDELKQRLDALKQTKTD